MEEKEKKNKRVRHPKRKQEKQEEEKKHFSLNVHDVTVTSLNKFGK
jgi:hypothetical protein